MRQRTRKSRNVRKFAERGNRIRVPRDPTAHCRDAICRLPRFGIPLPAGFLQVCFPHKGVVAGLSRFSDVERENRAARRSSRSVSAARDISL